MTSIQNIKQQELQKKLQEQQQALDKYALIADSNATFLSRCVINYNLTTANYTVFDCNQLAPTYNAFVRITAKYREAVYHVEIYDMDRPSPNKLAWFDVSPTAEALLPVILNQINQITKDEVCPELTPQQISDQHLKQVEQQGEKVIDEKKKKFNGSLIAAKANVFFFNNTYINVKDTIESGVIVYKSFIFKRRYGITTRVVANETEGEYSIALFKNDSEDAIASTTIFASEKSLITAVSELINDYLKKK